MGFLLPTLQNESRVLRDLHDDGPGITPDPRDAPKESYFLASFCGKEMSLGKVTELGQVKVKVQYVHLKRTLVIMQ